MTLIIIWLIVLTVVDAFLFIRMFTFWSGASELSAKMWALLMRHDARLAGLEKDRK